MYRAQKEEQILFGLGTIGVCLFVALVYMFCFYPQSGFMKGGYSDTRDHIHWAMELVQNGHLPGVTQVYPLYYMCLAALGELTGNYFVGATIWAGIFAAISCAIQIFALKIFTGDKTSKFAILGIGGLLSFVWPIDITLSLIRKGGEVIGIYLMSGATAPIHNLSYLCVKPFAIICCCLYLKVYEKYEKGFKKDTNIYLLLLAVFLFFSVLAKPNFYQCFAPAGALWTFVYWLKNRNRSVFGFCIRMAISFLPATIWVLWGMSNKINPMAFSPFEGIMIYNAEFPIVLTIFRAIAFVCIVFVISTLFKQCDRCILFPILVLLCGLAEFLLMIEPADKGALNLMWGYNIGMYVAFLFSCSAFLKMKEKINRIVYYIGWLLFLWHALLGLYAFIIFQWDSWQKLLEM